MSRDGILAAIRSMLHDRIGLSVRTIGDKSLDRALSHRIRDLGLESLEAYKALLDHSVEELSELVEEVVVPETWFFRNPAAFAAIAVFLQSRIPESGGSADLNILSVPCSTGEEPCSISMSLQIAGWQPEQFHIDAVDVSRRALERAKEGVYGTNSFRGEDLAFRDRFFDRVDERHWQIHDQVTRSIRYHQANILAEDVVGGSTLYDVIFCRNLLIYFERENQDRVAGRLQQLLKPDGMIFFGHAETGDYINTRFSRSEYSRAFSYYHAGAGKKTAKMGGSQAAEERSHDPQWYEKASAAAQASLLPTEPVSAEKILGPELARTYDEGFGGFTADRGAELEAIARLADEGRLEEAAAMCQEFIAGHDDEAQAYFLLGLIHEAQAKTDLVEEMYRKAIYLDPLHHEALIHLAVHVERHQGRDAAAILKMRAKRVYARKQAAGGGQ